MTYSQFVVTESAIGLSKYLAILRLVCDCLYTETIYHKTITLMLAVCFVELIQFAQFGLESLGTKFLSALEKAQCAHDCAITAKVRIF